MMNSKFILPSYIKQDSDKVSPSLNNSSSLIKKTTLMSPENQSFERKSPLLNTSPTTRFDFHPSPVPTDKSSSPNPLQRVQRRVSTMKNTMVFLSNMKEKTPVEKEFPDVNIAADMNMAISILKKKREAREFEELEYLKRLFLNLEFFREIQAELEPEAFNEIFFYLRHESFMKYRTVFNVGELGRKLYIILSGEVIVLVPRFKGKETIATLPPTDTMTPEEFIKTCYPDFNQVNIMKSGKYFGEIALKTKGVRTATIVTKTPCQLATLTSETFSRILEKYYEKKISEKILFLKNIPFLNTASYSCLHAILLNCLEVACGLKKIICHEGEDASSLYFIKKGQVQITRRLTRDGFSKGDIHIKSLDNMKTINKQEDLIEMTEVNKIWRDNYEGSNSIKVNIAILGPGEFFGLEELVDDKPKREFKATSISSEVVLYEIKKEKFLENFKQFDSLHNLREYSSSKDDWHNRLIHLNADMTDENKSSRFLEKYCKIQELREVLSSDGEPSRDQGKTVEKGVVKKNVIKIDYNIPREGLMTKARKLGSAPTSPATRFLEDEALPEGKRTKPNQSGSMKKLMKTTLRGTWLQKDSLAINEENSNKNKHEFYYHLKKDHDGKIVAHERIDTPDQSKRTLHPFFHSEKVLRNFYGSSEVNLVKFFVMMSNSKNGTKKSYLETAQREPKTIDKRKKSYEEKRGVRFVKDDQKLLLKSLGLNKIYPIESPLKFSTANHLDSQTSLKSNKRQATELSLLSSANFGLENLRTPKAIKDQTSPKEGPTKGILKKTPSTIAGGSSPSNMAKKRGSITKQPTRTKSIEDESSLYNFIPKKLATDLSPKYG